jgi:CheY-like chemotaxis protein
MNNVNMPDMVGAAKSLSRNPLGILALFIVLIYGFSCLVTGLSGSLAHDERMPLIYFLVTFPFAVLFVYGWLVSNHNFKLFAPSDFKNEDNFVTAVGMLSAASVKNPESDRQPDIEGIANAVKAAISKAAGSSASQKNILWVDDRPQANVYERKAFEAIGLKITQATSTTEAVARLSETNFSIVISDMGRKEGPREGYVLLDKLRGAGNKTPLFFYSTSDLPEHKRETAEHGGQGCTSDPQELFQMVTRTIINGGSL